MNAPAIIDESSSIHQEAASIGSSSHTAFFTDVQ
jgi:hypothetical protein